MQTNKAPSLAAREVAKALDSIHEGEFSVEDVSGLVVAALRDYCRISDTNAARIASDLGIGISYAFSQYPRIGKAGGIV